MKRLAGIALLITLILAFWVYPQEKSAFPQSLMPTFVPTPVEPTVIPEISLPTKATQNLQTLSDLKEWMETYLYPKGDTFRQQAAGQWLMMKGSYRRFTPSGSQLPSEGLIERWIRLDTQGNIQELLVIEENATGDVVQITYARGQHQWNSLGGWIPARPLSLEDLIGWNPTALWHTEIALPMVGLERRSMYVLLRQARYSPPIRRFGQYMVQGREEVWQYDKNTGLLLRHRQRMHVQDGTWITLWDVGWRYALQSQLPESRLGIYKYAVSQWAQVTP